MPTVDVDVASSFDGSSVWRVDGAAALAVPSGALRRASYGRIDRPDGDREFAARTFVCLSASHRVLDAFADITRVGKNEGLSREQIFRAVERSGT